MTGPAPKLYIDQQLDALKRDELESFSFTGEMRADHLQAFCAGLHASRNLHSVFIDCKTFGNKEIGQISAALEGNNRLVELVIKDSQVRQEGLKPLAAAVTRHQHLITLDVRVKRDPLFFRHPFVPILVDLLLAPQRILMDALNTEEQVAMREHVQRNRAKFAKMYARMTSPKTMNDEDFKNLAEYHASMLGTMQTLHLVDRAEVIDENEIAHEKIANHTLEVARDYAAKRGLHIVMPEALSGFPEDEPQYAKRLSTPEEAKALPKRPSGELPAHERTPKEGFLATGEPNRDAAVCYYDAARTEFRQSTAMEGVRRLALNIRQLREQPQSEDQVLELRDKMVQWERLWDQLSQKYEADEFKKISFKPIGGHARYA